MKKIILSLFTSITIFNIVPAQVNDGVKFLYYERLTSAKQALKNAITSNSKDVQAIYWLGQAYIMEDKLDSAKTTYQAAISAGVNDPLLWVGTGQVEILQGGDINAAKQRFEQAITSTTSTKGKNKGPDPNILNAIGRAMASGSSQQGDPNYGIDKLKQAAAIDPKNPDIYINLGLCYLKLGGDHGGEAFEAFRQATVINPQYARAYYRIGRVYQSQRNKESMDEWYGKAIASDAAYAPVYAAYFNYYAERDVNAAKEYLDKFVANADKDCQTDYFVGDYLFRAGKYQESLQKAKEMENGPCRNFSRINVLYAYDYDRMGDSVQARNYIQKYFSTAGTTELQPDDYAFAGKVLAKFPGNNDSSIKYLQKAIELDTVKQDKIDYINTAMNVAAQSNNFGLQMSLMGTMAQLKGGKLSEADYFKISSAIRDAIKANPAFDAGLYATGDSITKSYINTYPDKPQGYSLNVSIAKFADKDTTKGLAVEAIQRQNEFSKRDTAVSAKQTIFRNNTYLLIYYANYAKDGDKADNYRKAIAIADEMIALYPDPNSEENKYAANIKAQLQKALNTKSGGKQ